MIKMLSLGGIDNYQIIYRGRLQAQSLRHLKEKLDQIRDRQGTVRLITRVDSIPAFHDIRSLSELLKIKRSALGVVQKYAILTPSSWIKRLMHLADWMVRNIEVHAFDPYEAPRAIAWLNEDKHK